MNKLYSSFFIICLLLSGCATQEEFIESVHYPESTVSLYKENVNNGKVVLYYDETGFRMAFYSYKRKTWNHTANAELSPKEGFAWTMNNNPYIPVTMFAGVITDKEINRVMVKQKTIEQEAKIIDTKEGIRIWFAIFDILEDADPGESDPLKVEAFDSNGNIVWKNGVYKEGFFSGKTNK